MSAENNVQKKIPILGFEKFNMWTPSTDGVHRARLAWSIRDGNPRLTVFTNDDNDPVENKTIQAPMDPVTFNGFIELFRKVIHSNGEVTPLRVDCLQSVRDDSGRIVDKSLQSSVVFGKNEDGIIWISVVAKDRPKIRFSFNISEWHTISRVDGNPVTKGELSSIAANGMLNVLKPLYDFFIFEAMKDQIANPRQYSKNGNGGSKPSANKPTNTTNDDVILEDIPY